MQMFALRRLNKTSIIASACHFSSVTPITTFSSAKYDELINAAGRKGDFDAVRHLLSKRLIEGCLSTTNTFKFIATRISELDGLLQYLADLDRRYPRKHAHDALVAQLARLYLTDEALRVAEMMVRKNYGATATTFCPIINALAKRKDMPAALRVVDMMHAHNIKPNLMAFNYILTAYCSVGDVDSAADVLEKMEAAGMKGDAVTYDALVLGACRVGMVEEALAVMRRAAEEGMATLFSTYTHIIKEMLDCGYYKQASDFVRIFAGKNEKLDVELYGFVVRKLKNLKRFEEAKSVLEEMTIRGLPISPQHILDL